MAMSRDGAVRYCAAFGLWVIVLATLGCLSGCAQAQSSGRPSSTTVPTPSAPTPTPLPVAAVVAHPAGWTTTISPNRSGYTFPGTGVTGIRAQWRAPQVSGPPGGRLMCWIGLGGWDYTSNNLVRLGTWTQVGADGGVEHFAWYQTLPPNRSRVTSLSLSPGDRLFASIELQQTSPQLWHLLLIDLTSQQTLDVSVAFSSMQAYADVMVEDPAAVGNSPPYDPLASFSPISFSELQIRFGSTWVSAAAVRGQQVTMEQQGHVLASPGPLSNGDTTVQHV